MRKKVFTICILTLWVLLGVTFALGVFSAYVSGGDVGLYVAITAPITVFFFVLTGVLAGELAKRFFWLASKQIDAVSDSLKSLNAGEFKPLPALAGDKRMATLFKQIDMLNESTYNSMLREKQAVKQKSEFFANASHELKTPLTIMRGMAELLLQDESVNERQKKQIERIHKESMRLNDLIADMLEISKLERGEMREERVELALEQVVGEVFNELTPQMQAKNITAQSIGQGRIVADTKKIYEVVQNLCSNAIYYNKVGGFVHVTIEETENTVSLCVEDNGIGIDQEHLPRVCERFYRVDKSRSKSTGGTGLGLAIVKHVCALYGAKLSIESELGKGTKVRVQFKK